MLQLSRAVLGYPSLQRTFCVRTVRRAPFLHFSTQPDNENGENTLKLRKQSRLGSTVEPLDVPPLADDSQNQTEEIATKRAEPASVNSNSTESNNWSNSIFRSLRKGAGAIASTAGFISSSTSSFLTDRSQYRRLKPSVDALSKFLNTSGIELELAPSLNYHLVRNVVILSRIQRILNARDDRRDKARCAEKVDIPSNEEAGRYMRYATAAYGSNMILAAEMDARGKFDTRLSPVTLTRISEHIGVPEEDIVIMDMDYGNNIQHLRHFVAVDHANQKVVLSIRGTFTLSEIVVDVAAFSRPCYGGEAHSEMYTMAERVWAAAGGTVLKCLKENKGYEFIVTGHSLGAGCACLLNIICQSSNRRLIDGHKMRCFAYAAPPVFSCLDLIPEAVRTTTSYIHEKDVVPFLSVDSVRHVFASVRAIENYMQNKMSRTDRVKLAVGYTEPNEELIEAVREASSKRLEPKKGAPILKIPAAANVWMQEQPGGDFDFEVCDPVKLSTLGLNVNGFRMLEDHLPSRYEHAFENLMDEI